MKTQRPYVIIGAGPSGLATARVLQLRGIPFIGLESHSDIGGMWDIKNENSVVYHSAHLISSKQKSQFDEFPMPEEWPEFLPHNLVKQYLCDYADKFDLKRHFRFDTKVISTKRLPKGGWEVETSKGLFIVEGIIVTTGPHQKPNMPTLKGEFAGEIMHSKRYKTPDIFKDKRVLVVGLGNTACDIAVDAIPFASSVTVSVRESNYFVPKLLMGKPVDQLQSGFLPRKIAIPVNTLLSRLIVGKVESYGFPKPKFKFLDKHPILNSLILHHIRHGNVNVKTQIDSVDKNTVTFKDGSKQEFDMIMMATGYTPNFHFIADEHLNMQNGIPDFYLKIFHPKYNDLFIIGMLESTGIGWQGRFAQAHLVADYIHCMERDKRKALNHFDQQRVKPLVLNRTGEKSLFIDKDIYQEQVEKLMKMFAMRTF